MAVERGVFTLGHSPDPDDAFMFYAMAENKIDLRGYRFEHRLEDIQTLNERAVRGELHISAISIHAYAYVASKYALLPCGASMGDGYGPIVVRKRSTPNVQRPTLNKRAAPEFLANKKVAVPGKMTSAFLALQLFLGEFDYVVVPFDQIFAAVKNGRADAGLIIHEGQLTYEQSGFQKVIDLGEWWKNETGLPLPLGGNVLRKDIPPRVHDASHPPSRGSGEASPRSTYQRSFFGFWTFSVCFTTNDFTRPNSFWKPFAKLFGPYSKSTTKQKAKTMNRTSQNSPRSNPMAGRVTRHEWAVNAAIARKLRIEPERNCHARTVPVTDVS